MSKPLGMKKNLEFIHKTIAQIAGYLALSIEKEKITGTAIRDCAQKLNEAKEELEKILKNHGNNTINT